MTKYVRILALSLLLTAGFEVQAQENASAPALSAAASSDARGDWRVKDGSAIIRIAACGDALLGVISWTKNPGTDANNPDPAQRDRSVLGMPILLGMKPQATHIWKGQIYNADNGKTYQGRLMLTSADILHVEGCVLGMLCGGEDWTRVSPAPDAETAAAVCRQQS